MNMKKAYAWVLSLLLVICILLGINFEMNMGILRTEFSSLKRSIEDKMESKEIDLEKNAKNRTELKKKEAVQAVPFPLDVPLVKQLDNPKLYNGCEVTSLSMIMMFNGIHAAKDELAEAIERVPLNYEDGTHGNPNDGFVGNMEVGPGLGVYHGPIMKLAQKYSGGRARDLTGKPFETIEKEMDKGLPIWVITTVNFKPVSNFKKWKTRGGVIEVTYSEHSVVLTGYDEQSVYLNDPYGVKNRKVDRNQFIQSWNQMGKQAIVIDKAQ